ncbi:SERINE/THREONINE KINASE FAMILY PROTEIN [Salix koriyanagi]|uniref:non-specific serine/threonine protein kinase n=1 Tax=Salix koriyanagi TaxID=2511006 RepID=A0A9Q0TQ46_9ROSI|nr:SERINE/THREONINE KINASE FAMILY PROTEIN [Salix koriyanagi]
MIHKSYSFARAMGCCSCFGFLRKPKRRPVPISSGGRNYLDHNNNHLSQELLLDSEIDDDGGGDDGSFNGDITGTSYCDYAEFPNRAKRSEENLRLRELNGMVCRQSPVKETHLLVRSEDEDGNKMINEYVRQYKIGAGSYGKVVLYQSSIDGKLCAIKAFHKSHLLKLRVAPSETAMNDVLREVMIMKMLDHPNIVNLIEVIDDPNTDHFYMVLEYVDGKWVWEGSGPPGGIGEDTARKYLRDIVSGLMYLHAHNIVHGDIKPDNLLVTRSGIVKIGDFSVSQVVEDDNDELRRSPGTPVFTAPECCLGLTYHGKAADTWAVGVTLYCMILGQYPFLGETLQDTYDKIVNNPLVLPGEMNSQLKDLFEGLLCKDPEQRMTLDAVANHTWVIGDDGSIPQYLCWCKRSSMQREASDGNNNGIHNHNGICNHTESNGSNFDANMTITGKIV